MLSWSRRKQRDKPFSTQHIGALDQVDLSQRVQKGFANIRTSYTWTLHRLFTHFINCHGRSLTDYIPNTIQVCVAFFAHLHTSCIAQHCLAGPSLRSGLARAKVPTHFLFVFLRSIPLARHGLRCLLTLFDYGWSFPLFPLLQTSLDHCACACMHAVFSFLKAFLSSPYHGAYGHQRLGRYRLLVLRSSVGPHIRTAYKPRQVA